ncbi:MAG: LLM class flavin-dependent oxidoreductase [Candidatus Binatia bacterium]
MNIGLLFSFRNPPKWRKPFAEVYAEQLAQIRLAEELGYDSVWLTEHHFAEDGYSPSLLPIAAAIAATTRRVRIGTFLLLLPLHDALRVAEDAATVDVISNGRLDLGVGQGYVPAEFEGYGIPRTERPSRLREGIEILRGAWTQDPFSFEGKHYRLKDVRLMPKAVQQPHPPLWVGAGGEKAIDRAARLGCHFLGIGDTSVYDAALRRHGRDPSDHHSAQLVWVHLGPTREQAWDEAEAHVHWMLRCYGRWINDAGEIPGREVFLNPPAPRELRSTSTPLLFTPVIGTAEEVRRGLEEFMGRTRTTHLVLGMHLPGIDPRLSRRSMEEFASEVMPKLRGGKGDR